MKWSFPFILLFFGALLTGGAMICACSGKGGEGKEKILFDFETDDALDRLIWKCKVVYALSEKYATHGVRCLEIALYPSDYPGVTPLLDFHDWRGYRFFCFDIFNPGDSDAIFTLRIDDKKEAPDYKDRVNLKLKVSPGENHFKIPLDDIAVSGGERFLSLKTVERFLIFQAHPEKKSLFYLDHVRLISWASGG